MWERTNGYVATWLLQQARPTQRARQAHVARGQHREREQYGDRGAGDAVDGDERRVVVQRPGALDVVSARGTDVGAGRAESGR